MKIFKAEVKDLASILCLQKLAYQSEAQLVNDLSIPPLTQTLEAITKDFEQGTTILIAVENNEIIGSVRGKLDGDTLHIGRLIVNPSYQNKGIGTKMLLNIEELYPHRRYELFTSDKSIKNLSLYIKNGYKEFKRIPLNENSNYIYLEKLNLEHNTKHGKFWN